LIVFPEWSAGNGAQLKETPDDDIRRQTHTRGNEYGNAAPDLRQRCGRY
jgi:hypothetical protein